MPHNEEIDFREIGRTGLKRMGGQIHEEFLTSLKGQKAIDKYEEMRDNDPIVGASLFAIKNLVRQADWKVVPGGDRLKDEKAAEFVETAIHDLDIPWQAFIDEVMSMLVFGWSFFEVVYKKRTGNSFDPEEGSEYDDGKIGWKKFAVRSQDSWWDWEFDDRGKLTAFLQQPWPDFKVRRIPRDKGLLFRTTYYKDNPEGRSILRNAYRPWFFKKRIEELEGIGIERDLAGLPHFKVPANILKSTATETEKATLERIKEMGKNIRNDEEGVIITPAVYDDNGNPLFEFDLVSTKGRKKFSTGEVIDRKSREIAMSMLADFIIIGHESVGSFALASSKTKIFSTAIGAYMDAIAEEINKRAIPQLLAMNGMMDVNSPKLQHSDIETIDLDLLAKYIVALSNVGIDLTGDDVLGFLEEQAGLPNRSLEESEEGPEGTGAGMEDITPDERPINNENEEEDDAA